MLRSLQLRDPALFFPQPYGECYHYSPTTAALLYEVYPIAHRGAKRDGNSAARSMAKTALELTGTIRTAALAHVGAGVVNAAVWAAEEDGSYTWWRMSELPWSGIPRTAAIVHVRLLPCPLLAFRRAMYPGVTTKIIDIRLQDFINWVPEWIASHPYYFPALRQAELAARGLQTTIANTLPYLTVESLPSFACWAMFREVGNVRVFSPDLFDRDGNAIPSKTRKDPEVVVSRGARQDKKVVIPRASIVYELFAHRSPHEWQPQRHDGTHTNDRIENIVPRGFRTIHSAAYAESLQTTDAVFHYSKVLPPSLHFTRFWRHGIDRLAFDIDERLPT